MRFHGFSASDLRIRGNVAGWTLAAAALAVTAVHLLTVGEYPPAWYDEIEILEIGRFSIFDIHPEWSVNLAAMPDGSMLPPAPYFHYLSGAILEALYRLSGGFLSGRIFMLLSLPACAFALFAWLRSGGFPVAVSLATALLFLCDPNATICAHWYRPDLWCLTLTLVALVLINGSRSRSRPVLSLYLAGVLLATSVFFWITSALFLPLALLELWRTGEGRFVRIGWVALGGFAAAAVWLVPLYPYFAEIVGQYLTHSEIGTLGNGGPGLAEKLATNAVAFVKIALRSPFVWLTALAGVVLSGKRRAYAAVFAGLVAFMLATRVYHLRMVYLMPWLFLFAAACLDRGWNASRGVSRHLTSAWTLLAFSGMFLISVVLLNFAAWPEANTLAAFTDRLRRAVQKPSPCVYLMDMEHETYYAGRRLGWKMYSTQPRECVADGKHNGFLASMDAVVVTAMGPQLGDDERAVLTEAGFAVTDRFEMPPAATGPLKAKIASFVYAHGYPSCEVWTR